MFLFCFLLLLLNTKQKSLTARAGTPWVSAETLIWLVWNFNNAKLTFYPVAGDFYEGTLPHCTAHCAQRLQHWGAVVALRGSRPGDLTDRGNTWETSTKC